MEELLWGICSCSLASAMTSLVNTISNHTHTHTFFENESDYQRSNRLRRKSSLSRPSSSDAPARGELRAMRVKGTARRSSLCRRSKANRLWNIYLRAQANQIGKARMAGFRRLPY